MQMWTTAVFSEFRNAQIPPTFALVNMWRPPRCHTGDFCSLILFGRILSYVPYLQNCHFDRKKIQCYTMMLVFSLKSFNFTFCNTFPSLLLVFSNVSSHCNWICIWEFLLGTVCPVCLHLLTSVPPFSPHCPPLCPLQTHTGGTR